MLELRALVIQLDHPVDLLIGYLGEWTLAEIKASPKATFRLSQIRFLDQCGIRGLRAVAMDHIDDVDTYFPIPTPVAGMFEILEWIFVTVVFLYIWNAWLTLPPAD